MSLYKNLLDTYEQCRDISGIRQADSGGNIDERKTLLPLLHTTLSTQIHITLDTNGNLLSLSRDSQEQHIIIPCTEDSMGRTSGVSPHPLCEQLGYLDKKLDSKKYDTYIAQLKSWMGNNIKIVAIYKYIIKGNILDDIASKDLFYPNEKDKDGNVVQEKVTKIGVRFSVEVAGDTVSAVWDDEDIRKLWMDWVL